MTLDTSESNSAMIEPVGSTLPRPRSVTLLALGMLAIAAFGLLRAYLAIRQWQFLAAWPGVSPAYLAFGGLAVGLLCLWVFWALWWRKTFALRLTWAAAWTLALAYWLDQVFVADHPYHYSSTLPKAFLQHNWPFAAGVTLVFLFYTAWVVRRVKVKTYYGETNE